MISYLITLLAGAVGGGLSKFFQDMYTRGKETRAIAAALEAEISLCVEGIRRNDYIGMCDRIIVYLSEPDHIVKSDGFIDLALPETACPIFKAHLSRVGLLGEATGPVVKTCELYEGVCQDLRYLRDRHGRLPLDVKQLIGQHEGVKARFEDILRIGKVAITQLQRQKLSWRQRNFSQFAPS